MSVPFSAFADSIGLRVWGSVEFAHPGMTDLWDRYDKEELDRPFYSTPLKGIQENAWATRNGKSQANADFGTLGVYSYAHVDSRNGGQAFWVNAFANARFFDDWYVDAGGLNGTIGTLSVLVALTGSRTLNADDHYSGLAAELYNGATNSSDNTMDAPFWGNITAGNYILTTTFKYGVDNNIRMTLSSGNAAGNSPDPNMTATSYVDFLSTAKITGLNFYDASGNNITGYTMTTGSGHEYIPGTGPSPVPEPATMALLLIGLLGASGVSRRKK